MSSVATLAAKRKKLIEVPKLHYHIGFVGSGNMARALVEGIMMTGQVPPSNITASATSEESDNLKKMKAFGVNTTSSNRDIILTADVIIVAVKPHHVLDVLGQFEAVYTELSRSHVTPKNLRPLIVSVASSVSISEIEQKMVVAWSISGSPVQGHLPVIRSLPNAAASVRAGVTVYSRGHYCNESDAAPFLSVFTLCSHCEEVSEKDLDAFTTFSGCGITFMSVILEAMADGGVLVGLPRAMAQRIAAYTMISAGKAVAEGGKQPSLVKEVSCSPGGTSIHGLEALEEGGLRASVMGAVKRAIERAEELRPSQHTE